MTRLNNGIVCTIALLVAASSQAQQFSSFGSSRNGVGLTKVDSDMVSAATHQLNAKAALQPGDDQSWANPKSGHSGKITVTKLFTSGGLPCHSLHYDNSMKKTAQSPSYSLNWCKVGEGVWKIKN